MPSSNALKELGSVVDGFLHKNKLTDDDYFIYLAHACDVYREINTKHGKGIITAKVTISSLGIIEMPLDMIGFSNLYIPIAGELWSFTDYPRKVTTTTIVNNVETQDSTQGEGVDILKKNYLGYSGVGGVNDYGRKIDWTARRIFCDGIKEDTAILVYTSSGLQIGISTFIPVSCIETIDWYLRWQKAIIDSEAMSKVGYNEEKYKEAVLKLRVFNWLPSRDELEDAWNSAMTPVPQR